MESETLPSSVDQTRHLAVSLTLQRLKSAGPIRTLHVHGFTCIVMVT